MSDVFHRLIRTPQGMVGSAIVGVLLAVVLVGPWIAPYSPEGLSPLNRYKPPSAEFLLGTDHFGRDILSRLLHGARSTILLALLATFCGTLTGALIGTTSAFVGGRFDEAVMRTIDAIMAVPSLLLSLLVVAALGRGAANAALAIAIAFTPGMARITRSVALTVRKHDYISAAVARGETPAFIVVREMLPNVIAPVVVEMTIRVAFSVMLFATLSFLGLGAQPPAPEWGLMVSEARKFMHLSPWMIVVPSAAIALVAIGFNLLGDGLRDALNPKTES